MKNEEVSYLFSFKIPEKRTVENKRTYSNVQIAKTGTFNSRRYGKFTIDEKVFDELIKNFKSDSYGSQPYIELPFDAEHEPKKGAYGWIQDVYKKEGKNGIRLMAKVEWTDIGVDAITNKRFKFVSPSYIQGYTCPETGNKYDFVLRGAALTVDPFLKGMEEVSAKDFYQMSKRKLEEQLSEMDNLEKEENVKVSVNEKVEKNQTEINLSAMLKENYGISVEDVMNLSAIKAEREAAQKEAQALAELNLSYKNSLEESKKEMEKQIELNRKLAEERMINLSKNIEKEASDFAKKCTDDKDGKRKFKKDMEEKIKNFASDLLTIKSGVIELSNDKTENLMDRFSEIIDSISAETVTDLTVERGHSQTETVKDFSNTSVDVKAIENDQKAIDATDRKISDYAKKHNLSYRSAMSELISNGELK